MKQGLLTTNLIWPLTVYLAIGPFAVVCAFIEGATTAWGRPGDEAAGLTFAAGVLAHLPHLYLTAGLLQLLLLKLRNRYCLLINALVMELAARGVLGYYQARSGETSLRMPQEEWVGHDNVRTERWCYRYRLTGEPTGSLRYVRHWRNGQPDGVWLTFDRQGKLLKRQQY